MIVPPTGVRVWLANGYTDMRRGMNGLALQVQEALQRDPHAGDLYVFRGRRGDRATLCILPFRDLVAGVSCPLGLGRSCLGAG
jgi:transposase